MRQDGHIDYTSQVFDSSTLSVEIKRWVQITDFCHGLVASLGRVIWMAGLVSSKNWAWKKTWTAMVYQHVRSTMREKMTRENGTGMQDG